MSTYFVYKINKSGRRLLSEHLHEDDAKRKARRIRGGVVTDELGKVVLDGNNRRRP